MSLPAKSRYDFSHPQDRRIGREFPVNDDYIRAVAEESAGRPRRLEPLTHTVLAAVRETTSGPGLSGATFVALRAEFDSERFVDLFLTIAFYNGLVRLRDATEIDAEEDIIAAISTSFCCRGDRRPSGSGATCCIA